MSTCYTSRTWWENVTERAVKTFAQTTIATVVLPSGAYRDPTWIAHNWLAVLAVAAIAAGISVLTSAVQGDNLRGSA